MIRRFAFVILPLAVLAPSTLWAQSTAITGTIVGTVLDETSAVLPGVRVKLTHETTGISRTVTTDSRGVFRAISGPG